MLRHMVRNTLTSTILVKVLLTLNNKRMDLITPGPTRMRVEQSSMIALKTTTMIAMLMGMVKKTVTPLETSVLKH